VCFVNDLLENVRVRFLNEKDLKAKEENVKW